MKSIAETIVTRTCLNREQPNVIAARKAFVFMPRLRKLVVYVTRGIILVLPFERKTLWVRTATSIVHLDGR